MIDYDAYDVLTHRLTNMHCTERDLLVNHVNYRAALDAVKAYQMRKAVELVQEMRTPQGDAWRAKQGLNFVRHPAAELGREVMGYLKETTEIFHFDLRGYGDTWINGKVRKAASLDVRRIDGSIVSIVLYAADGEAQFFQPGAYGNMLDIVVQCLAEIP